MYVWGWKRRRFKYVRRGGIGSRRERYVSRREGDKRGVDWYWWVGWRGLVGGMGEVG